MSNYQPPPEEEDDRGRELYKDTRSNDNGENELKKSFKEDVPWKMIGGLGAGLSVLLGVGYAATQGVSASESYAASYEEIDSILDKSTEGLDSGKDLAYDILLDPETVEYSLQALDYGSDLL